MSIPNYDENAAAHLRIQLMSLVRRLRRESGHSSLSFGQIRLLASIERLALEATPSALARAENMQSSNLAAALRELEARELVSRQPDPRDRRKVRLSLTEAGMRELTANRQGRDQWLMAALDSLSAHERELLLQSGAVMEKLACLPDTQG
ncbi:MAG: MarR family winged helix-turn-helix transcriptional regulator [Aeromonadaceae bacterium]